MKRFGLFLFIMCVLGKGMITGYGFGKNKTVKRDDVLTTLVVIWASVVMACQLEL